MFPVLLSVVVISFSGALMPGPTFAVTLAKSYRSPLAGTMVALGHAVIELPVILLVYFGLGQFFQDSLFKLVLSLAGGGMIIWMGINMYRVRSRVVREGQDIPQSAFRAGVMTTGFNPFFLLWWATVGAALVIRIAPYGLAGLAAFSLSHWLVDLAWLSFISVLVFRTHHLLSHRFQEGAFIACSLLLVGFGLWFIISGVQTIF